MKKVYKHIVIAGFSLFLLSACNAKASQEVQTSQIEQDTIKIEQQNEQGGNHYRMTAVHQEWVY